MSKQGALVAKMPRYTVQRLRKGGKGNPRWMDVGCAYDCYSAFQKLLATKPTTTEQLRVMDRKRHLEVLWPSHDMRCTPPVAKKPKKPGVWVDEAQHFGWGTLGRIQHLSNQKSAIVRGRVDNMRFVQSPRHG